MAIKTFRPITPSSRYMSVARNKDLTSKKPEKRLVITRKKSGGRNSNGRITSRGIGGGHKQKIRVIDFKRKRHGEEAEIIALEYDPIRTAHLALIKYPDGSRSYIVAPEGLKVGSRITSGPNAAPEVGNCLPLEKIPLGQPIHNIELQPGRGGQLVRSAGSGASLMSRSENYAQVRLPSGEIRRIHTSCYAVIGQVGNAEHEKTSLGKAGRSRHRGRRPLTRAVAKNPIDHPMGGGAGKTSGGGHPMTPWGKLTKGYKTRKRHKHSDRFILVRRDGRPFKRK